MKAADRGRITVVDQVYHQNPGQDPTVASSKFSRLLDSTEQAYVRRTKVGETWSLVDRGWIESCSLMVVENLEGQSFAVVPTPEERAEVEARVVELGTPGEDGRIVPFALVRPGLSGRFEPYDVRRVLLRCRSGVAQYTVTLFPA